MGRGEKAYPYTEKSSESSESPANKEESMPEKNIYDKRALTMKEAAEYACVSRATLTNWIASGLLPCEELPSGKPGQKYRFRRIRRTDLDRLLDKSRQTEELPENTVKIPKRGVFLLPKSA